MGFKVNANSLDGGNLDESAGNSSKWLRLLIPLNSKIHETRVKVESRSSERTR